MKVVIIKSLNNNFKSIIYSLKNIGINPILTDNKIKIKNSNKLIISNFLSIKKSLLFIIKNKLDKIIYNFKKPVLAISNGLYILCYYINNIKGLNIFKNTKVKNIYNINKKKKNNIGWNKIYHNNDEKLFKGINNNIYQYFIDYYYIPIGAYCISHTNYIISYCSSLKKKNFYGLQFYPEFSGYFGRKILKNFIYLI
ncbi:MAG: imidazole glycerol phosphate synthase subunit HisH [Candidatus Shikimatogenerans bostrichidophilus]|nr:MAG: imidazole glycerol phosphate synthase subunit HisH [Candidatus Shikimatogenerans bostrichidophilus]